ncbi:hypothetical protein [Helicobacter sp. 11S02629-2]|uniref:phage adaptor protein n=1 Tax=Helicobacter sp. 11S02629-2 TaxID=1476195 RepID=UPI000BA6B320|nr:hypothetical protein [Helicobacter sp. 11S02629-2]PAF42763.1 hypothetical protein BKH40_07675 [Helicobacter sp. 11S02629-2]
MKAYELERLLRSRLRDTKYESLTWSENEVLDILNITYTYLNRNLKLLAKSINLLAREDRLKLPSDFLELMCLKDKEKLLSPLKLASFIRDKKKDSFSIDGTSLRLSPNLVGLELELSYYALEKLKDLEGDISLPEIALECFLFYSMYLLLQKQQSPESLKDSMYYKGLFEAELLRLKSDVFRIYDAKDLRSRYIKV